MGETVEARLQSARQKQQEAIKLRASMEAKKDAVVAKRAELMQRLQAEGFDSPEAAVAEVAKLSAEVDTLLAEIEEMAK